MRSNKSEVPLTSYDNLRLDKPVEESIKMECFPESFMKKFTHALEGIETQDVCAAIERHSNRYGVPN